jgi:hypothetical protein
MNLNSYQLKKIFKIYVVVEEHKFQHSKFQTVFIDSEKLTNFITVILSFLKPERDVS